MDSPTSPQYRTVLSPDLDAATVDATRWLVNELRSDGVSVEETARVAAEHLAEQVAMYGGDFDPTDAELEQSWNAPDAPEVHKAAWRLHQETHDRSAS